MTFRSFILLTCCIWVKMAHAEFQCSSPGRFIHSADRSKYHQCHFVGDNKFSYFLGSCPLDSCFDGASETCDPEHCDSEPMPPSSPDSFTCTAPGKFPHLDPSRKEGYFKCIDANGKLYFYEYQCLPTKPCFSYEKQRCQLC